MKKLSLIIMGMGVSVMCLLFGHPLYAVDTKEAILEKHQQNIYRRNQRPVERDRSKDPRDQEKEILQRQLSIITGDEDTNYIIVPGDTVSVSFKDRSNKVVNVFQVTQSGEIHMPLIGNVKINGLNRKQAREKINELLKQYIRYPEVSIQINAEGDYVILGAAGPGVFDLEPNLKVMQAILNAGYDEKRANLAKVMVMRGGRPGEEPNTMNLDLKKMMEKGDREDNILVKPGDVIYVPNTWMYDLDNFKDEMFELILDYYTLGGSTFLKENSTPEKN